MSGNYDQKTSRTSNQGGEAEQSKILPAGTQAPGFELPSATDQTLKLSDLRGHPVILAFYPADWSPVCGDLLSISVDGVWCHAAFARDRKLRFPLLSDFEPKGEVSRMYGAYREEDGTSHAHASKVRDDFRSGVRSGVNGTPTFFIDGVRFDGDWSDPELFIAVLERAAAAAQASK